MDFYNIILKTSKTIALTQGVDAINIRLVAKQSGVSVGSVYNYFPSKTDLIIATIKEIWQQMFNIENVNFDNFNFLDCIQWFVSIITDCKTQYPNFFNTHFISFTSAQKPKAKQIMDNFLTNIKKILITVLDNDKNIRQDVFDNNLTKSIFIDYIFNIALTNTTEDFSPLLKLVKNSIY